MFLLLFLWANCKVLTRSLGNSVKILWLPHQGRDRKSSRLVLMKELEQQCLLRGFVPC